MGRSRGKGEAEDGEEMADEMRSPRKRSEEGAQSKPGVGGVACEDGGDMGSLGRVVNSIQSMGHWTKGEGGMEGRTVGRSRDTPRTALLSPTHSTST